MKTIIAGSREFPNVFMPSILYSAISECGWEVTTIVSGTARGVDRLGEIYAEAANIPCERYPAQWNKYGKSAGYKRNVQMTENAEALIAIWDGKSKGTKHMIDIAKSKGLQVYVKVMNKDD